MKICCVFNHNPLYRYPIYKAMSDKFDCDFYFARQLQNDIKIFDPMHLQGFKGYLDVKRINRIFARYKNIRLTLNKEYTHYILTGEPYVVSNWIIILYALICRKKILLWTHGVYSKVDKFWTRLYLKLFYGSAHLLLYGESVTDYMLDLGCRKSRISYIHNSLDTDLQSTIYSKQLKSDVYLNLFKNDNPVVIYIGRIQKVKKLDHLVYAIKRLKQDGHIVNLMLVGSEAGDNSIRPLVESCDLSEQVCFYGESYDEHKNAEFIYNADVCVSPGNVGLTCIHALTYGTPVITNNNFSKQMPEYEAVVPGITGDFFKEDDINDLAGKILNWSGLDDRKREGIRCIARRTILDSWSVDYQMKVFAEIL